MALKVAGHWPAAGDGKISPPGFTIAGQAGWQDVFAFLTPQTETNWTEPDPAPGPASFYRVRSAVGP